MGWLAPLPIMQGIGTLRRDWRACIERACIGLARVKLALAHTQVWFCLRRSCLQPRSGRRCGKRRLRRFRIRSGIRHGKGCWRYTGRTSRCGKILRRCIFAIGAGIGPCLRRRNLSIFLCPVILAGQCRCKRRCKGRLRPPQTHAHLLQHGALAGTQLQRRCRAHRIRIRRAQACHCWLIHAFASLRPDALRQSSCNGVSGWRRLAACCVVR